VISQRDIFARRKISCELFHSLHSLIDPAADEAHYPRALGYTEFFNTYENTMTTLIHLQTSKYARHGSIAVMPVCLWTDSVVLGST